jgi:PTH1 family peptidyl-tRNA hydrolase
VQLIIGLGNPGARYAPTRHNIGFTVVDRLAGQARWAEPYADIRVAITTVVLAGCEAVLVKPLTYMNDSGRVVPPLMAAYTVPVAEMLVVLDDINLPLGTLRIRRGGSAGGHHGLESIIQHLGSATFPRLRLGVGRNASDEDLADYVLDTFNAAEYDTVQHMTERAVAAITDFVAAGLEPAMNHYNTTAVSDNEK